MNHLALFTKYWQPGLVKTRLAQTIGAERAAELSFEFFQTLVRRFAEIGDQRCVLYAPENAATQIARYCGTAWQSAPQSAGDLGQRLRAHFSATLATDADTRLVVIGSDSPTLPSEFLTQAFERLQQVDVVLCPSDDGGYCLVGAARRVPPIFDDIAWGTPQVWQQTIERLQRHAVTFDRLPEWFDVDELDGLQRLAKQLESDPFQQPQWRSLRDAVQQSLSP